MKDKGKRKKLIIAAAAIAVIAGLGIGTFAFRGNHKATSVEVYPVSSLTGWGELTAQNEQTTGTIVDQFSQDVKMLEDYPLNRVHVRKGQKVKKGDILVTYNARRQELELKLKEIEVRRRERDVQIRENSLETLRKTGKDPYTGASDVDGDIDSSLDDDDSMDDNLDYTDDDASLPGNLFNKDALLGLTVRAEDPEEGTTQAAPEATTQAPEEEQTEASTEATESTEVPDTPQLADIFESMKDGVVPGTCYEVTDEGLVVYVKGDQGTPDVAGQAILDAIQRAGDTKSPLNVIIKRYSNQEALDNGEEPNKQIEISMGSYVTSSIDADSTYSLEQIEKRLGNINDAKKVTITSKTSNATKKVTKGSSYTYQLNLDGKKVSNGVRWSVSGNKKKKTSIDSTTGTLTIASNETAKKLRIIATLNGVSRYITVKVGAASSSDVDDDDDDDNGGSGSNNNNKNNRTDRDNTNINTDDDSDVTDAPLTGEELREAIADRESELEEKKLKLQEAEITYEEYKAKYAKATVRASMNGTVTLAKTKADNPSAGESIVVVKSRSGVYVEINVNEVNLDKIHLKGKLTCTKSNEDSYEEELDVDDYEGKRYTAIVTSIADYPNSSKVTTDNYYDYATVNNPDTSYYTVVGTIKNGNGLNPGDRMKVTFSAKDMDQEANVGIEVMTPFVRQDGRRYYVYKRDDKKRLVKQYVTLGNSANGYSQVLDGITEEDYIAFPYSKTELEGARTKKCDDERTQEVIETLMNSQEFTYY